jgi:rod shape-determining protein MreB and related proteins
MGSLKKYSSASSARARSVLARARAARATRPATASRGKARAAQARGKAVRQELGKVVKLGLHFGDRETKVAASKNGDRLRLPREVFTNLVGFLKLSSPRSGARQKSGVLYAEQAVKFLQQVDLKKPIQSGLVSDVRVCRQFITHIASQVEQSGAGRFWGVASIPAMAGRSEVEKLYRALKGPLERVVIVPEPYLVAEGMRLEQDIRKEHFGQDLTRGSLVIDIGAGTTDLCLVQGGFPTPEDQVRLEVAGNFIDDKIFTNALVHSPTLFLSRRMAREIKEEQAFVGSSLVGESSQGSDLVALTEVIRKACDKLLEAVAEATVKLLGRLKPEAAESISSRLILTGGGSQIRNLPEVLQESLRARGFPAARIIVPKDFEAVVARGALRFAEKLSDEEWKGLAFRSPGEAEDLPEGADGEDESPLVSLDAGPMAWMDVGLRSQAAPGEESEQAVPQPAPRAAAPDPSGAPRPGPARKEKKEEFTSEDLEQLDLFKGL